MWAGIVSIIAAIVLHLIKYWIDHVAKKEETIKSFYAFLEHYRAERGTSADMGQSYEEQLEELFKPLPPKPKDEEK